MHPMINMALRAGRRASQVITRAMDRLDILHIEEKQKNDLVSEVDRNAESAIIDVLHQAYPEHGIIGEESGTAYENSGEYTWIIDPLDGTTNFLHGIPHFCISIALMHKGLLDQAVIIDPLRNEEFIASRGAGAQLNGKRLRVTDCKHLEQAVIGSGIPPRDVELHLEAYMNILKSLTQRCRGMRRSGSAALDLAYVAAGRLDGFFETGLKAWDIAAGALLVQEAGGMVSSLTGAENYLDTGHVVAAGNRCFKPLLQAIHPHLSGDLVSGASSG